MNLCKTGRIAKNKSWEFQIATWEDPGFEFRIKHDFKGDHAGFVFDITIWKLMIAFRVYDNRHWDWEKDCWVDGKDL